jgi:hypothetical protein
MDDSPYDPAQIPAPASYHWTPRLQREFLEAFATNGSVKISAAKVGMSPSAVYQLKQRPEGAAFRIGCAAAVLIARTRLADELLDRAIWGIEEYYERGPAEREGYHFHKRRRHDPRLGLAMLARLDRAVDVRAKAGEDMLAQIIAGDWDAFLALFDAAEADGTADGQNAALALWLAGRDNRANPLAALWRDSPIACEVARISADCAEGDAPAAAPDPTPEEEAAAMDVWPDGESGELRTNFPPPDDFMGIEEGQFGDADYERTLDDDEEAAFAAIVAVETAPLRAAGEAARRAFFGLGADGSPDPVPDAANDAARDVASAPRTASRSAPPAG